MRWSVAASLAVALAALAAGPAQAFPIPDQDYAGTVAFAEGFDGQLTFLSGRMSATVAAAHGPYVFLNATGLVVTGLTHVCWPENLLCETGTGMRLEVSSGGDVALHFPRPVASALASRHSLAFFVDVGRELDFDDFRAAAARDLAAVHIGATVSFGDVPPIPTTTILEMGDRTAAGLLPLTDSTRLTLHSGGRAIPLPGGSPATFQGSPTLSPFLVEASLVPFPEGATARFEPADAEAAQAGLAANRITRMMEEVKSAFDSGDQEPVPGLGEEAEALQPLLGAILGGAMLAPPGNVSSPAELQNITALMRDTTLVRFSHFEATGQADGTVALSGSGPLKIQGGRVVGGPGLVGVLPWWCWLLWLAALGMWVARLVVKPPVQNERWDQYRWVGWVAGPLAGLLVFVLWDAEVHALWGLSLLRGSGGGAGFLFLLLAQVLVGILAYVAIVTPLSSLLKSGARFGGQGRFMGLHRPVAMLLGFLAGATLMLSYTDFLIQLLA